MSKLVVVVVRCCTTYFEFYSEWYSLHIFACVSSSFY